MSYIPASTFDFAPRSSIFGGPQVDVCIPRSCKAHPRQTSSKASCVAVDDLATHVDKLTLKAPRPTRPTQTSAFRGMGWMGALNPSPAAFACERMRQRGNRYTPYHFRPSRSVRDDTLTDDSSSSREGSPFSDSDVDHFSRPSPSKAFQDGIHLATDHLASISLDTSSIPRRRNVSPPVECKLRAATFEVPVAHASASDMEDDDSSYYY